MPISQCRHSFKEDYSAVNAVAWIHSSFPYVSSISSFSKVGHRYPGAKELAGNVACVLLLQPSPWALSMCLYYFIRIISDNRDELILNRLARVIFRVSRLWVFKLRRLISHVWVKISYLISFFPIATLLLEKKLTVRFVTLKKFSCNPRTICLLLFLKRCGTLFVATSLFYNI